MPELSDMMLPEITAVLSVGCGALVLLLAVLAIDAVFPMRR